MTTPIVTLVTAAEVQSYILYYMLYQNLKGCDNSNDNNTRGGWGPCNANYNYCCRGRFVEIIMKTKRDGLNGI